MWAEFAGRAIGPLRGLPALRLDARGRQLREWFAGEAAAARARPRPSTAPATSGRGGGTRTPRHRPGVVIGSHLDSVPDGGAFDGPLGVVSAFAALDALRADGFAPGPADRGGQLRRRGGRPVRGRLRRLAADHRRAGAGPGPRPERRRRRHAGRGGGRGRRRRRRTSAATTRRSRRIGAFVELHVEQGRGLIDLDEPVGGRRAIWPHGRWRIDLPGEANHAGTTRLEDRRDPMLALRAADRWPRAAAARHDAVATCGKVRVDAERGQRDRVARHRLAGRARRRRRRGCGRWSPS